MKKYIVTENQFKALKTKLNEMGENDIHLKHVMQCFDDGDEETKIKMAHVILGKKKPDRNKIYDALREMGYLEILDVEFELDIVNWD